MQNKMVVNRYKVVERACREIIIEANSKEEADKIIDNKIKFFEIDINYDDIVDDMFLTYKVVDFSEKNGKFHYIIEEKLRTSYVLILPKDFNNDEELNKLLSLEICLNKYPIKREITLDSFVDLDVESIKKFIADNYLDDNIEYNFLADRNLYKDIVDAILTELNIINIDNLDINRIAKRIGEENNRNVIRKIIVEG